MGSFGVGQKDKGLHKVHQSNGEKEIVAGCSITVVYHLGVMAVPVQLRAARRFMNFYLVRCAFCGKNFSRSRGRANEARKFKWKQFCSPVCLAESKMNGCILRCTNPKCNKNFYRKQNQIKKVKNSFCSHSCAAVFNNKRHNANLPTNLCKNPLCRKPIPRHRKYCSILHRINPRKIPPETYKEKIIARILAFHNLKGRIPVKREMYGMYKTARELFGTWNNAIIAAGLRPNPVRFAERQIAKDGHMCDSLAEKIIDDWLYSNNIKHERNVLYPNARYTVDFRIKNKFVEFFGLNGELAEYDKNIEMKEGLAKKYKLNLVKIYPKDLFPVNHLSEIIKIKQA